MKPVPLSYIRRLAKRAILDELSVAQATLNSLPEADISAYIDRNAAKWSALKEELWKLGNMKCWYSEKRVEINLAEIEHFRPKKRVTGERHKGYWWCAFKWDNFRIAHPIVNKRITDYYTGNITGKGCYFPLHQNSPRAICETEQAAEIPVLLDPVIPHECDLIEFDSSNGRAVEKYKETENAWLFERANTSIKLYCLDDGNWAADREDIMKAVAKLCDELIDLKKNNPDDLEKYQEIVDDLYQYLNPFAEFLSAAEQVMREKCIDIRY